MFLRRTHLDRLPIAAHSETTTSAVTPWLSRPLWYAGTQRWGTYNKWDQEFDRGTRVTYPAAVSNAQRQFAGRDYLLMLNVEMPDPPAHGFRPVYRTTTPIFAHDDEQSFLYRPIR